MNNGRPIMSRRRKLGPEKARKVYNSCGMFGSSKIGPCLIVQMEDGACRLIWLSKITQTQLTYRVLLDNGFIEQSYLKLKHRLKRFFEKTDLNVSVQNAAVFVVRPVPKNDLDGHLTVALTGDISRVPFPCTSLTQLQLDSSVPKQLSKNDLEWTVAVLVPQ